MTNPIRMTYSNAAKLFATADPIAYSDLTEHHLDMLQMLDLTIEERCQLAYASDGIAIGDTGSLAIAMMVEKYNAEAARARR